MEPRVGVLLLRHALHWSVGQTDLCTGHCVICCLFILYPLMTENQAHLNIAFHFKSLPHHEHGHTTVHHTLTTSHFKVKF